MQFEWPEANIKAEELKKGAKKRPLNLFS